jgi:peptidyl-prolyl cis-trans isomerase C
MKPLLTAIGSVIATLMIAAPPLTGAMADDTPNAAAVVNGVAISKDALAREMHLFELRIERQGQAIPDSQMDQIRSKVLDNMINLELLHQESQKEKITVDASSVDQELAAFKARFPTPEAFRATLEDMQITEDELRTKIRENIGVRQLLDKKIGGATAVTDEEMQTYYNENPDMFKSPEQVRARHILIRVAADADDAAKADAQKRIEAIGRRIESGEDFAELAKETSEGPSKTSGGDLGYFGRGRMVKPFEEAAFATAPGEVSGVVTTPFGYHLIQVIDKKPASTASFADVKDKLAEHLQRQKVRVQTNAYIDTLRKDAKIQKLI